MTSQDLLSFNSRNILYNKNNDNIIRNCLQNINQNQNNTVDKIIDNSILNTKLYKSEYYVSPLSIANKIFLRFLYDQSIEYETNNGNTKEYLKNKKNELKDVFIEWFCKYNYVLFEVNVKMLKLNLNINTLFGDLYFNVLESSSRIILENSKSNYDISNINNKIVSEFYKNKPKNKNIIIFERELYIKISQFLADITYSYKNFDKIKGLSGYESILNNTEYFRYIANNKEALNNNIGKKGTEFVLNQYDLLSENNKKNFSIFKFKKADNEKIYLWSYKNSYILYVSQIGNQYTINGLTKDITKQNKINNDTKKLFKIKTDTNIEFTLDTAQKDQPIIVKCNGCDNIKDIMKIDINGKRILF